MGLNCRLSTPWFSEGSNNLVMLRIPTYFTPTTTLKSALTCANAVLHVYNYSDLFGPESDLTDLGTTTGMTQLPETTLSPYPNTMMCYDVYSACLAAVAWETSGFCIISFLFYGVSLHSHLHGKLKTQWSIFSQLCLEFFQAFHHHGHQPASDTVFSC